MIWNCPHCNTVLSLRIDLERSKRAYVRCGKCSGVALLVKDAAYADREATQGLPSAELTPPPFDLRKATPDSETLPLMMSPVRTVVLPPDFNPPPFTPPATAFAPDPSGAILIRPANPLLDAPLFDAQGALKKKESEESSIPSAPMNPPAQSPLQVVHQFEFREASKEISRIHQFPKPPEFLTRQNELLEGAFQTVTEKLGPKKSQKPLSIAVVIAALFAIFSGIYLFVQGQKLLQEGRHAPKKITRFSQQDHPARPLPPKSVSAPPAPAPRSRK